MKYTLITLAALPSAAFAQTIVNGDFSDTSGMSANTYQGVTYYEGVPSGWTSDNGDIQVITPPFDGNRAGFTSNYVDVSATTRAVTLSQQVSGFTPGQQYTVSYDWGNRLINAYDMTISMGGTSASHTGPAEVVAASNHSFTFTAGTTTETLSIAYNHTNGNSNTGFNSTNFTVTPVPEPSSAALLGLGGLALILRRRK